MKFIISLSFILNFSFFYYCLNIKNNNIKVFLKNIITTIYSLLLLYLYPNMSFYIIPLIYNLVSCDNGHFKYYFIIFEFMFIVVFKNYLKFNVINVLIQLGLISGVYISLNFFINLPFFIEIIIYSFVISFNNKFNINYKYFIANFLALSIFFFLSNYVYKKIAFPKDSLTNLQKYGYLNLINKKLLNDRKDYSILFIDIDDFKYINDSFGHIIGNKILKELATILKRSIRPTDFIVRYGGEEFIIILQNTEKNTAIEIAERIRKKVESHTFINENKCLNITISIGISSSNEHYKNFFALINTADKNLYKAKSSGKNCIYPKYTVL